LDKAYVVPIPEKYPQHEHIHLIEKFMQEEKKFLQKLKIVFEEIYFALLECRHVEYAEVLSSHWPSWF